MQELLRPCTSQVMRSVTFVCLGNDLGPGGPYMISRCGYIAETSRCSDSVGALAQPLFLKREEELAQGLTANSKWFS